jgi:hypothetical protein
VVLAGDLGRALIGPPIWVMHITVLDGSSPRVRARRELPAAASSARVELDVGADDLVLARAIESGDPDRAERKFDAHFDDGLRRLGAER